MSEKQVKKLKSRGIFTVTQLSCTYHARKKKLKSMKPGRGRSFALQALAIREKKTYVIGVPELAVSPVRIYFDIEGDPERDSHYLLGMIVDDNGVESRYSFWSDGEGGEDNIAERFLEVVRGFDGCRLYCYGTYELSFLKRVRSSIDGRMLDEILGRTTNILSVIYDSIYFPVHYNGLKDIAGHLGYRWADPEMTSIRSIVWRRRWEETRGEDLKRTLLEYNLDDCAALRAVTRFIEAAIPRVELPGSDQAGREAHADFSRVEEYAMPTSRRDWCKVEYWIPEFEAVNGLAYFDYQRQRVYLRNSTHIGKMVRRKRRSVKRRTSFNLQIDLREVGCPACGGARLSDKVDKRLARLVLDLRVTERGIKNRIIKVVSPRQSCLDCGTSFIPSKHTRIDRHSHALKSWAMYEHIAHRIPLESLEESFRECFGLRVHYPEIHGFKYLMARYYQETYDGLLKKLVSGNLIHADETEARLKDVPKGYVWVFTNLEEVVFRYRPNREGGFLRDLLDGFQGVLVTDFYAAYDMLPCAQQKCLIHLIRDINQDIIANPFDEELKTLASDFGRLLREIVTSIDRHGLSQKHLGKHRSGVTKFFSTVMGMSYQSEVASALQGRFVKYQDKLFTFLDKDGVPWNNNNAEHAAKRFAYYREVAGGLYTESGLPDHLILLSLHQTCVYKGVSFFKFLVSQEKDIDEFSRSKGKRKEVSPYSLYPEGFVPPRRRRKSVSNDSLPPDDRGGQS